ncbi:glycoside hydrolase family 99-like domain-containing protein [uncultured Bacteroides sp.]|uniref:glycosyltransferase WbsX family protein n=1 Tax=uncultured Bacteroides sp. TaxID=162156 RepID=UPI00261493D2|nr:glycoside hydrolase family 99-like domain-containing protein [uncultured Bacteroides sp.]
MNNKIKLIAYYLPQFYQIPFNDAYWGKGYTEWTATTKAKPLFKGHYQPHIPADLGFYNLLMPEAREAQAEMAKEYGIDGFCYWHYWFGGGKTIMEKPIEAVLRLGKPDFPFCFAWANHNWGNPKTQEVTIIQEYLGDEDIIAHFNYLLPFFKDHRYIKIDNKPIFTLFSPPAIPDINHFIQLWNQLAMNNGFNGIHFIGSLQSNINLKKYKSYDLDSITTIHLDNYIYHQSKIKQYFQKYFPTHFNRISFEEASKYFITELEKNEHIIPTIIAGWDHSPRSGKKGLILTDYTPNSFKKHIEQVFKLISMKQNKLCFIKSWNEWGEGNHLEPDLRYGLKFLETLAECKNRYNNLNCKA